MEFVCTTGTVMDDVVTMGLVEVLGVEPALLSSDASVQSHVVVWTRVFVTVTSAVPIEL